MKRCVLALLMLTPPAARGANVADTAAFSRIAVGARAPALGGGISALDDEATALASNPAGLARLEEPLAGVLAASALPLGRSLNYAAVAGWPAPSTAAGFSALWYGEGNDIEYRRANTDAADSLQSAFAQSYALGAAWRVFPPMELGVSVRLLLESIGATSAWGFSGDLGIAYHPVQRVALSFVMQDAGGADLTGFNWSTDTHEEYTRLLRAGAAVDLNPVLVVVEGRELGTARAAWSGGIEADVTRQLVLRAGVDDGRLAAGFGLRLRVARRADVGLDYALAREAFGDGSYEHRLALTAGLVRDAWPRARLAFPTESPEAPRPPGRPAPLIRWPGL